MGAGVLSEDSRNRDHSKYIIDASNNKLSFTAKGAASAVKITIPTGSYTATQMATKLNGLFAANGLDLSASSFSGSGSQPMFSGSYSSQGTKTDRVVNVSVKGETVYPQGEAGAAPIKDVVAEKFFYNVEHGDGKKKDLRIQLSDEIDNHLMIEKRIMNTAGLGINTCTITKEKYASKAVDRLNEALSSISTIRSYFGAVQNRLEHSIENLKNIAENTQAAESEIRDANMAEEMVKLSISSILKQAGISIMSQSNQANNIVLSLLK